MSEARSLESFVTECLEVFDGSSSVSGAELGMAFRAWTDAFDLSDDEVAARVQRQIGADRLEVRCFGGSLWIVGAQLSGIGQDMVLEGVLAHRGWNAPAG